MTLLWAPPPPIGDWGHLDRIGDSYIQLLTMKHKECHIKLHVEANFNQLNYMMSKWRFWAPNRIKG